MEDFAVNLVFKPFFISLIARVRAYIFIVSRVKVLRRVGGAERGKG